MTERRFPTYKVRRASHEEIQHIQGKEQQLCFAGVAMIDNPCPRKEKPKYDNRC